MKSSEITIYTIFDNISCLEDNCCKALWGFSTIIQTPKHTILFDTGSNGRVLLENIKQKKIDILDIDTIFLSHGHWDHIGGVDSIVEINSKLNIYATKHLSKNFINDYNTLSNGVKIIEDNITNIYTDIYSSGAIGDTKEQSIIIDTDDGLIIIYGCAHNGVDSVAKMARDYFKKDILLLLGGFHLSDKSDDEIFKVIHTFKKCNTKYICPSHCTGKRAKELFKKNLADIYIDGGLGQSIKFDKQGKLKTF